MDKKTLLAILLTAVVVVITPIIFPSAKRPVPTAADSAAMVQRQDSVTKSGAPANNAAASAVKSAPQTRAAIAAPVPKSTVVQVNEIHTTRAIYSIASPGGVPTKV